jgi:RNA polymerase sigma factor (sigma-70 family)
MGIMDKRRQERCELTKEEREFIEKLYRTNQESLFNYAIGRLEKSNAEEAVQNVFLDLCRKDKKDDDGKYKIEKVMQYDDPVKWLYKSLKLSISQIIRKKQQLAQLMVYLPQQADIEFGVEMGMEDFVDNKPMDEDVDFLYSDLAVHKEFQLIKEFTVEDKSLKDLADKYGVSIRVIEQRLYRARIKIRKLFGNKK